MALPIPYSRKAKPEPPAPQVQNTHSSLFCTEVFVNAWENDKPGTHILFVLTHGGF